MALFRRPPATPAGPDLPQRVADSACRRVAVLALHPGAGAGTVLAALASGLQAAGLEPGLTSAAGGPIVDDPAAWPGERTRLPAGVVAATDVGALDDDGARVTILEPPPEGDTGCSVVRVDEEGPIVLHGPEDGARMAEVLDRLERRVRGPLCVSGRWERRSFAAPGRVDGWVLAVGAAFSPTPERAAAAVRHHVELTRRPPCDELVRLAWEVASSRNDVVLVGDGGAVLGSVPAFASEVADAVERADRGRLQAIVFPGTIHDELVQPLVRGPWRGALVAHDATRIHAAPVYYRAWVKEGGSFQVVRPCRLIAIATNPVSPVGEDADPREFRDRVAEEVPDVPVHDVVLDAGGSGKSGGWRLWHR